MGSGIEPGDRVALWAPNSAEWVITSFAVYAVGAVLVPLNTRYRGEEAGHVLRTSRAAALRRDRHARFQPGRATRRRARTRIPPGDRGVGGTGTGRVHDRFRVRGPSQRGHGRKWPAGVPPSREQPSDIIFTSGTTGKPKGAVLGHGASVRTYLAWSDLVGLRRDDRYLVVYPSSTRPGSIWLLGRVLRGATIVPHAVFDVVPVMQRVAGSGSPCCPGRRRSSSRSSTIRTLPRSTCPPAPLGDRSRHRPRGRHPPHARGLRFETVVTGYGLTETTGTVEHVPPRRPPEVIATTVGRPLPGVKVRIVDAEGAVAMGDPGEILVQGFNVMKEYFEDPAATQEAIDEAGWLRTGDIGILGRGRQPADHRPEEGHVHRRRLQRLSGRDRRIMVGHPQVGQVAVVGVPDDRLGEVGVAFVVPRPGVTLDPHELVAWCRDHMANFKVPRLSVWSIAPREPHGQGHEVRAAGPARRVSSGSDGAEAVVGRVPQVQATIGPATSIISDS